MNHEPAARRAHAMGSRCSNAVYGAFDDINPAPGPVPAPRSEGGKCGAVLAAEKLLRQMGLGEADFDRRFAETFGSLKCGELRKRGIPCNDLVGGAARLLDGMLDA